MPRDAKTDLSPPMPPRTPWRHKPQARPEGALSHGAHKTDALLSRDLWGASEPTAAHHHLRDMLEVALARIEELERYVKPRQQREDAFTQGVDKALTRKIEKD